MKAKVDGTEKLLAEIEILVEEIGEYEHRHMKVMAKVNALGTRQDRIEKEIYAICGGRTE